MYKVEGKITKWLLGILIIFLIICISTSMYYGNRLLLGSLEEYNNDDVKYLRSAETLIKTGMLTYRYTDEKTVFIMPGIIFTLVPFVGLFGQATGAMVFRIFSAFVQTFTLYVLFLIIKKIFKSDKLAFLTVLLNVIYVSNIYVTTQILSETMFFCLLINLIYICIYAVEEKSIKLYIIGGIIWGISILFKPIMLVFPANIFIIMLFNKYSIKEIFKYALIPICIAVVILLPWWIRNYIVFDKFVPLTLSSGNPKLQGAYIDYEQNVEYKKNLDFSKAGEYGNEIQTNERETNEANIIIKYNLKNNPKEYLYWMIIGKTIKNFNMPFIWYSLYGIPHYTLSIYFVIHYIYLILGIIGIVISIFNRKYKEDYLKYLLIIIIVFFNVVHLPYYCFPRYVYPIMPIVIAFGATTIMTIIQIIKKYIFKKEEM